ncbi:MAG TPA: glycosyltransferase 87 family protein [Solirubrobacterales bacterium]|nr:glycosyltransferase 87 family protein [Solirubrobacterales bacterium]
MASVGRRCIPLALIALAVGWLLSTISSTGDWPNDSAPAVEALASGHVSEYLEAKAMMGSFSTLVQAPFVALAPAGDLTVYRWAAFPCVLAAGLLGLYLAAVAGRRGASVPFRVLLAALCLFNPITIAALDNGHPEEILTASLVVGAVASAAEGRRWTPALLLGLALASKQWAVLAILPTLMALPSGRFRVGLAAAALAAALTLPALIASPEAFTEVQGNAASTGRTVTPWSVWYPTATEVTEVHRVGDTELVATVREAPALVGELSHPLIVLLVFALPLGLALKRRGLGLGAAEAMALLALLALLRAALDPVDNLYYHAPLLLALLGWDAVAPPGRLPLRGLTGAAVAFLLWEWSKHLSDFDLFNVAYVAIALAGMAAIAAALSPGRAPGTRLRVDSPSSFSTDDNYWRDEAPLSGIKGIASRSINRG